MELKDKSLQAIVTRIVTHGTSRDVMANEIIELARVLDDERDARRAMGSLAEHRAGMAADQVQRLTGEIAERSQRQMEITGRLTELERRMAERNKTTETIRDLQAQAHAQQQAIADVWELVEMTDGYGSPFWAEPGLDDTTPAQAVGAVLEHLRAKADQLTEQAHGRQAELDQRAKDYTDELTEALGYGTGTIVWSRALDLVRETILQRNVAREQVAAQATVYWQLTARIRTLEERNATQAETIGRYQLGYPAEAMAALNAADRQADDDQICRC